MIRKLLSLTAAATVALASITIILAGPLVAQEWKLMRNENGIRAYARSIPGSKLLELKAITIIDAKMEVIGEVLRDVPSNPEWMADCSDARIVHLISPKEMIVHTTLDFPAPVSDRDLVVRSFTTYLLDRA
ncbi:MAG TPA: START domain-containing protein, partial [Spirochaetota bacterium]|nr:START domain-containing protein [Spirochaetota bacterium]